MTLLSSFMAGNNDDASHHLAWSLPSFSPPIIPGVASGEVEVQKEREASILAVHYTLVSEVPDSPDESLIPPYLKEEEEAGKVIPWISADIEVS